MTITAYVHKTHAGPFTIELRHDGRWHVTLHGDDLGSYQSAQVALDDLVGGHTRWPSCGDPSVLGMSSDLNEWEPYNRRVR